MKNELDNFIANSANKYFVNGQESGEQITTYLGYNLTYIEDYSGKSVEIIIYIQTAEEGRKPIIIETYKLLDIDTMDYSWKDKITAQIKTAAYNKLIQLVMKNLYKNN